MNFAQICALQWTKIKRCFERIFYYFTILGVKSVKNLHFEENTRFRCSFYLIQVQVIKNRLADLKNANHLIFLLMTDFFMIFKKQQLILRIYPQYSDKYTFSYSVSVH